jgi:hypothetical protein
MAGESFGAFMDSIPSILAGKELRVLAEKVREARRRRRALIWGFGGHVVKVGLARILIDLMNRGFVTCFATNGAGMIHDFEIGLCGHTSEDVAEALETGDFGMARETSLILNQAVQDGAAAGRGIGESVGACMAGLELARPECSLLLQAHLHEVPLTVHVAIGTDTVHTDPTASGEAIGKGSLIDFRILTQQTAALNDGGVYINLGSAVILPEVFLKAVSLVRNAGSPLKCFTTANLDFIQHYRPTQNVLKRPTAGSGTGIALTGHHEIMVPLLAGLLIHGA